MHFLASGDSPDPLGHVLDANIVGGPNAMFMPTDGAPIITLHMVTLVVAALFCLWALLRAARSIETGSETEGNDRYLAKGRLGQFVEVVIIYLRDQVCRPVLGRDTDKYLPYLLTLFFFLLANNLLGLLPLMDLQHLIGSFFGNSHFAIIGGTATGNLAVTGAMAIVAFIVIQVHGLKELGLGGWSHHFLGGAPVVLAPIMIPVEIMSLLIKPGALAIRLFANMMAGHILLATIALFGLMAFQGLGSIIAAFGISLVAGAFAVAITFLELFVAFLQAFIFMFLTTVFIGQLSHHSEHDHEHGHEPAPAAA